MACFIPLEFEEESGLKQYPYIYGLFSLNILDIYTTMSAFA